MYTYTWRNTSKYMYTVCCQVSIAANWMTNYRRLLLCERLTFHLFFFFFDVFFCLCFNIRVSCAFYRDAKFLLASMSRAHTCVRMYKRLACDRENTALYHLSWPSVQNAEPQSKLLVDTSKLTKSTKHW